MKTKFLWTSIVLACLAGPALADGAVIDPLSQCPLTGPAVGQSQACQALRGTFREGVDSCMQQLKVKASVSTGDQFTHNSHTNRARMLICDREVRERMGLAD